MLDLSIQDGVARLCLRRPEARNAIPLEGWPQLRSRIEEAESRARLLIVAGEGDAFCAGADIAGFERFADDPDARTQFRLAIRAALDALRNSAIPTIAVVDGACYGAGVALAIACDIRFAGPGARFAVTPAKLGISYPQEDVHRLVALVGPGQAARLLLGAQSSDGSEAERIGLVECFDPSGGEGAARAFAEALLANDDESLRTLKRGLRLAAEGVRSDDRQDREFDALLGSAEVARRIAAHRSRSR